MFNVNLFSRISNFFQTHPTSKSQSPEPSINTSLVGRSSIRHDINQENRVITKSIGFRKAKAASQFSFSKCKCKPKPNFSGIMESKTSALETVKSFSSALEDLNRVDPNMAKLIVNKNEKTLKSDLENILKSVGTSSGENS
ncbi:MAG: hypothetical protein LBB11_04435 [Puniceicoccales bacterium]|jgi:hypothetical protein|nr:hypothetical protein [Puniceicoccales bacterium]